MLAQGAKTQQKFLQTNQAKERKHKHRSNGTSLGSMPRTSYILPKSNYSPSHSLNQSLDRQIPRYPEQKVARSKFSPSKTASKQATHGSHDYFSQRSFMLINDNERLTNDHFRNTSQVIQLRQALPSGGNLGHLPTFGPD